MRSFVRDHFVNALSRKRGRLLRIEEERRFEIGDAAPVLHRAAETAGNCDLIEFRQWIANTKVIVVVIKNLRGAFEGVSTPFGFSFSGDHADLGSGGFLFDEIELAGDE